MVLDVGVVTENISEDIQEEVQRILVQEVYLMEGVQGEVDTRTCLKIYLIFFCVSFLVITVLCKKHPNIIYRDTWSKFFFFFCEFEYKYLDYH